MERWIPVDGDAFLTRENFIFCVFGYEHPDGRATSFLKYIPSELKNFFSIPFLKRKWRLQGIELLRPEKLYTAKGYQIILQTLRHNFPHHTYYSPLYRKEIVSPSIEFTKRVYTPRKCLQKLQKTKDKDELQRSAVELATLLSEESDSPIEDFGIRGSLALDMHTKKSDIDLAVYGAENFRKVEKAVEKLSQRDTLSYIFSTKLDRLRKFRGRFKNAIFMFSAVRKDSEIDNSYGEYKYNPVRPVTFKCRVVDDGEAMFKPAIYEIDDYQPLDSTSEVSDEENPRRVTSMIGCYRNVARNGDRIRVSGTLERVEKVETGNSYHQVVVGTAIREDEYLCPVSD